MFTPGSLLYYIKQKLYDKQFLEISYKELCEHLSINSHKNFKNAVKKLLINYKIYILYFDPVTELRYLYDCPEKKIIKQYFDVNLNVPAARFEFATKSIIVLNSTIIKDEKRLEQSLDHELNHIFEHFLNDDKDNIENLTSDKIQTDIERYFIDELGIKISNMNEFKDYAEHMFGKSEFYEMISDLCNILSLYFNEKDSIKLFRKLEFMLTDTFINSTEFKKLEEPVKGSILFAYTCKRFSPKKNGKQFYLK